MNDFINHTPAPSTEQLTREEIARQLLPLLHQFEATYDRAILIEYNLYPALKRLIFVVQYHASQGGDV